MPIRSSFELATFGQHQIQDFNPNMLILLERIGSAEHHEHGEHVPLQLKPGVGRVTERVADHRVARRSRRRRRARASCRALPSLLIEPIDRVYSVPAMGALRSPRTRHRRAPDVFIDIALPFARAPGTAILHTTRKAAPARKMRRPATHSQMRLHTINPPPPSRDRRLDCIWEIQRPVPAVLA